MVFGKVMSVLNHKGNLIGNPKGYTPWNKGRKGYRNVSYHAGRDGRIWACRKKICRVIDGYTCKKGYRQYAIHGREISGHRLVALQYLPNPDNLEQVDHINRVRHDNRVENLRWVSRSQNCDNRVFGGTTQQAIDYLKGLGYTIIEPNPC